MEVDGYTLCIHGEKLGVGDHGHFELLKSMVSFATDFSGFCFTMGQDCCSKIKFSAIELADDTIRAFRRFLIQENLVTHADNPEPKAKRSRSASKLKVIRFDHIESVLNHLGASQGVMHGFHTWCHNHFLDPLVDIDPITYLTAFIVGRVPMVDCKNVSVKRNVDSGPLCVEILSLEQFPIDSRRECVESINPLAHALPKTATYEMYTFLKSRGLPMEIHSMLDPETLVIAGGTAAALWNPDIKLLPSSDINLFVLKSDKQKEVFRRVLVTLRYDGRFLYKYNDKKCIFQAVGRFKQGLITVELCAASTWRQLVYGFDMYIGQACYDGRELHATLKGAHDMDTMMVRGGFSHKILNLQRVRNAMAKGFDLDPRIHAWKESVEPWKRAPKIPVLNPDLPRALQDANMSWFNLHPIDLAKLDDYLQETVTVYTGDEDNDTDLTPGLSTLPWKASDDCVLHMRPLDPMATYQVYPVLPACTSWYKSGVLIKNQADFPTFIPAGTGVCVTADLMYQGWAATSIFLA